MPPPWRHGFESGIVTRMDLEETVLEMCRNARRAARVLATSSEIQRNAALGEASRRLRASTSALLEANARDRARAMAAGMSAAFVDRLTLTEETIEAMAAGIDQVTLLPDPLGQPIAHWRRPNGLEIVQVRVPIGVVGVIYESRPNVTADAAALCVKSGNAVILRGGSEAFDSNAAIASIFCAALAAASLPREAVQLVPSTDRRAVAILLRQKEHVDVIVPRGGESLIRAVAESSSIPVIQHYAGICHTYVDEYADIELAQRICFNAKVQRPSVCNAMENLLVHAAIAERFLPPMGERFRTAGVELRGCERTRRILPYAKAATDADWDTEYLDLILAIKVVDSIEEAIDFIRAHGTGLADAIVSEHRGRLRQFLEEVDSSAVFANASTRFTDGFEFGFGAEIGISTNRLHARGPVGLRELTTYKYVVYGNGQIRE